MEEVVSREYEPSNREHIVIDTRGRSMAEILRDLEKRSRNDSVTPGKYDRRHRH